jgi:hypothetical protein
MNLTHAVHDRPSSRHLKARECESAMGDTRSRPAVFGKFNRTCRRIEGMATNNPGTKTRSFQQVAPLFWRLHSSYPHIRMHSAAALPQNSARGAWVSVNVCAPACGRLEMRRSADAARCDRQIPAAKTTTSTLRAGAHYVYARKEPRNGERGAVLAAS